MPHEPPAESQALGVQSELIELAAVKAALQSDEPSDVLGRTTGQPQLQHGHGKTYRNYLGR